MLYSAVRDPPPRSISNGLGLPNVATGESVPQVTDVEGELSGAPPLSVPALGSKVERLGVRGPKESRSGFCQREG